MTESVEGLTRVGFRQLLARCNQELHSARSPVRGYVFSVVSFAIALVLGLLIQSYGFQDAGLPVLTVAVGLTAWYAGIGPLVLAVVLATVSYDYFFVAPIYAFTLSPNELTHVFLFVLWAVVVASFSAVRRSIDENLRQTRDRLQVEVEQRTQQARLLDQTHDAIFVRDANDAITFWNRGAQELYGWSAEKAVGKCSHDLLKTDFPGPLHQIMGELHRSGRWEGELRHTKADGTEVIIASRWSLHHDEQGQPIAILETSNDITERTRRENEIKRLNMELGKRAGELEAANKELEAFSYSVSHDLRAPLRHVAGYAQLLQKQASSHLDDKSRRYMTMIMEASKRMGDLIDDLLAFSRIGRTETNKTTVNLEQLAAEAIAELGQETKGRDIAWTIGTLPACHGDRSMLKLVFLNLLSNAIKFTRERTRAEIEMGCAEENKDEVTVFVKDNGAGFDMRYVNKLFGVF